MPSDLPQLIFSGHLAPCSGPVHTVLPSLEIAPRCQTYTTVMDNGLRLLSPEEPPFVHKHSTLVYFPRSPTPVLGVQSSYSCPTGCTVSPTPVQLGVQAVLLLYWVYSHPTPVQLGVQSVLLLYWVYSHPTPVQLGVQSVLLLYWVYSQSYSCTGCTVSPTPVLCVQSVLLLYWVYSHPTPVQLGVQSVLSMTCVSVTVQTLLEPCGLTSRGKVREVSVLSQTNLRNGPEQSPSCPQYKDSGLVSSRVWDGLSRLSPERAGVIVGSGDRGGGTGNGAQDNIASHPAVPESKQTFITSTTID
uniref:Uncharacterized protein n=1 Tax=Timema shepardi TaxID=629360 RepID=A0A7R9AWU8_TIMSH|nr:unnamed protein product [Timema shepardi]